MGREQRGRKHTGGSARREGTGRAAAGGTEGRAGREGEGREGLAGLVLREHGVRVGLALGGVRGGDGVDDGLGLFVADFCGRVSLTVASRNWVAREGWRTLVVVYDISQVVPAAVMRLAHAHRVVRQVDVAVVACFW